MILNENVLSLAGRLSVGDSLEKRKSFCSVLIFLLINSKLFLLFVTKAVRFFNCILYCILSS
mgnify:CR=1 FL=1